MDRRHFLKRGAIGASGVVAAGAVTPLEGTERPQPKVFPPDDMEKYLDTVDHGVFRMSRWPLADRFPGLRGNGYDGETLARDAMISLYMTGMFGDLPAEYRAHTGMQDRMWAAQPTMDRALDGVMEFLRSRTPDDLSRVRSTLRDRPEVLHEVVTTIDTEAARSGVSESRRAQLRTMFTDVAWRLANQPPELIIDEYVGKVERATASDVESAARQRSQAAHATEEMFWQEQKSLRERRISRGLRRMGIGAALFGVGLLLVAASDGDIDDGGALMWIGLVPGITVGSILFTVGLVTLLIGAATDRDAM
ncbi:MAG: hypothetical protein OEZ65_16565 [Gemmatimonadota bacterium]|nr:hypothetical protein [Gemmatimonadota bacterium]MDH5761178.1 hypothetical protein [Gemmatimonadota bacterium]